MTQKNLTIALVGNPNCGKTSLFNLLTGSKQKVGNWPGVTVEKKTGQFIYKDKIIDVVDLPGIYSLTIASETLSLDERIACDYIATQHADVIINIVDASNLERNLYLTTQLLEMRIPMIIALNMMDVARSKGLTINLEALANQLGCIVIPLECNRRLGITPLKEAIPKTRKTDTRLPTLNYLPSLTEAITTLSAKLTARNYCLPERAYWFATRLLEDDLYAQNHIKTAMDIIEFTKQLQQKTTRRSR